MDYHQDPTRIARGTSRSVLAVAAAATIAIALLAGAMAIAAGGRTKPASELASMVSPAVRESVVAGSLAVPPDVRCHDVASRRCARIAQAALIAAADPLLPRATTVDVWATLLCGSTFDCPPYHLIGRQPAGSAIVGFASSLVVWVNVTEIDAGPEPGSSDLKLDAWVIRSGRSE